MIFFLKGGEMFLKSRKFDKFLINVYVIISFFLLINLCIYFFMVTYNRYRSTLKGPKGPKGPRGRRGLQGENSNCNVCTVKTKIMKKMYDVKPQKEILKNEDVVVDLSKEPVKGWQKLKLVSNDKNKKNYNDILGTSYVGVCNGKCNEMDTIQTEKNKPMIGVAANVNGNTYQHFNTLLMVINSIQEEDIYQNYLITESVMLIQQKELK